MDTREANSNRSESQVRLTRFLAACGTLLILSGVAHLGVWGLDGGEWEGPVSWRKPILFGISTGMTVLSVAWIYSKLQPQRFDTLLLSLLGISLVVEVALITLQQWRGVASHFNHETSFDGRIENWMTILIVYATILLCDISRRCFTTLNLSSDLRLAVRGGLAYLIVSCLIGFAIYFYGNTRVAAGADPSTFGQSGVTKFPHGAAIHAIQFFPGVCWLLGRLGVSEKNRRTSVWYLIVSMGSFLALSLLQTLSGKARFDLDAIGGTFLLVGLLFLVLPVRFLFAEQKSTSFG